MPQKILYYLGAGASANALPLARSIERTNGHPPIIQGIAYQLKHLDLYQLFEKINDQEKHSILDSLSQKFKKLGEEADKFGDVDTYAKYLHLMQPGGKELRQLKQTLSQFFVIKQVIERKRDSRYVPWLVSIMNTRRFPDDVKILSWNYDFQVELAAELLASEEDNTPILLSYPDLGPTPDLNKNLSLIHLNGIAGLSFEGEDKAAEFFQEKSNKTSESILPFLEKKDLHSNFHFAWEESFYHSSLMKHVKSMIKGTTILVVIGYSFPFFNRNVDKEIINEINGTGVFRKIYYQDLKLTGEQLRAQFGLMDSIHIEPISDIKNFLIPFEY